ncbi:MAG TPA: L-glutamate gamma-semialdehyde dehydrogenase, partial [Sphingobium sp.]|nr:L-glutamate gamma-semialdehyde dehydrogenase [Sphingobium sp.]
FSVDDLTDDPAEMVRAMPNPGAKNDRIALPAHIYPDRHNSTGVDLSDESTLAGLSHVLRDSAEIAWTAAPTFGSGEERSIVNPADHRDIVGTVMELAAQDAAPLVTYAASSDWGSKPVEERAAILERAADAMQVRMPILLGLLIREAGKSLPNAIAEVREAVDFLRYYAVQARASFGVEQQPLGPIICISPWNFPLAIFTGQVAAALMAGNPVLAKPAGQTPLIAAEAVRLLHEAGVPRHALQLTPGDGALGSALVAAPDTAGVMFTGSTAVARLIQRELAKRLSPAGRPIPLVAETGGQNAMIVDSSALAEQVVADVLLSAFDSAGQRCSALRVLCLQKEVADRILLMLKGALQEMRVGRPDALKVDIGPVITREAKTGIEKHIAQMRERGARIDQLALPAEAAHGTFVAPTIIEIDDIAELKQEVFGPVLHVVRFCRERLDALIDAINATGYGLTFGLHTRLDETVAHVAKRVKAGNLYVNRNMIDAVVGVQPFGGRGLSGTGPKAGGPLYLNRLVTRPPVYGYQPQDAAAPIHAFADWLAAKGESGSAANARQYAAASSLGTEVILPGPVGESNLYSLHPRGLIWMKPTTRHGLFEQMAAVLATGNRGLVANALPDDLPRDVAAAFSGTIDGPCSVMLVEGDELAVARAVAEAAAAPGPIISVHAAEQDQPLAYHCDWLLEELSISINTTAAGGNASLMMVG